MDYLTINDDATPATANVSRFSGASGITEWHLMVLPTVDACPATQRTWLKRCYDHARATLHLPSPTAVFRRFFSRDPLDHRDAFADGEHPSSGEVANPCAVSNVGQPPCSPAGVALWAYHLSDPAAPLQKELAHQTTSVRRGDLTHHWTTGLIHPVGGAYDQTLGIFGQYAEELRGRRLSLAEHTLRTWLFVRDIDNDYVDLVTARQAFFATCGLTPDTHFIASTGIQGAHPNHAARVAMDAYAVAGVRPEQIQHLAAPDHLSPTHHYGVTFERGTAVTYRDRRHVLLSGTASIDAHGEIVHPHDLSRQLDRTLTNMSALLQRAGATLTDMAHFIVYLRNHHDCDRARQMMHQRMGNAPILVVTAPVCRPGWLVEVEGWAVIPAHEPKLPPF